MKRSSLSMVCVLVCIVAVHPAKAQTSLDPTVEAKIQNIENDIAPRVVIRGQDSPHVSLASRMASLHVPGVSVAVIHDGKLEWARGFGVTKVGGPPVTADTLFQAGSISKPVTAMAVLHLVQSGRLDLDASINSYLKTWKLPENEYTSQKSVTLRGLLTHTAGVTVHGFPGYASGKAVPTLVQVLNGEPPANTPAIRVDTVPRTIWRYSGGGYVITQQMLLDVTGKPFPAFMKDAVLGPLGMSHSTYEQPLPAARSPDAATPYDQTGAPIVGGAHTYPEMAPAGLWTTPSDLARYAIAVQKSLAGQSNVPLSKAVASEMVKPGGLGSYGLGPHVGGSPDHPYFEHGGVDEGFVSQLVAYDKGDGVVVMTNSYGGGQLADEVIRTVAREYHWPDFAPAEKTVAKVDPKLLDTYAGNYRQGRFIVINVSRNDDHLTLRQGGQTLGDIYPDTLGDIYPERSREWFSTNNNARISFAVRDNGEVTALARRMGSVELLAARIGASEAAQIADELGTKVKNQTQDPATEAALRQNIDGIRNGKPDYDKMSPGLANVTREQLSDLHGMINALGAMKSVAFKGVGPAGADIYDVEFEKGSTEWRVVVGVDGKTESIGVRMLP